MKAQRSFLALFRRLFLIAVRVTLGMLLTLLHWRWRRCRLALFAVVGLATENDGGAQYVLGTLNCIDASDDTTDVAVSRCASDNRLRRFGETSAHEVHERLVLWREIEHAVDQVGTQLYSLDFVHLFYHTHTRARSI